MRGLESPFRASQKTVGERLKNKKHRSGVLGETLSVPEPEDETTPEFEFDPAVRTAGRVAHFVQESVYDRAAQRHVPAQTRRLAENDVGEAFAQGEIDRRIGDVGALQIDYLRSEFLGEPQALRERDPIFRGAGSKESTTTRSFSFRQGNLTK